MHDITNTVDQFLLEDKILKYLNTNGLMSLGSIENNFLSF